MTPIGRRVAVLGGNRIPFARSDGPYATASNQEMLSAALGGLVERFGLRGALLGEFVAGAVVKHSRDFNLARETVLGSALDRRTPAYDVQQACGTGLEAVILVANKIALGQIDVGVAGGVDTASDVPLALNDRLRQVLLRTRRAKGWKNRARSLAGLRPGQLLPEIPRNAEPRTGLSMGEHAARTAVEWGIGREAQDRLAADSHQRLAAAWDDGFFTDLVTPFNGLARDQNLRPNSTPERLATLRPVFGLDGPNPTMTAGNSTPLTDGAATVLLASEEWAAERGLPVLAYLTRARTGAVDFVDGPDGLLTAPARVVPELLDAAELTLGDVDFVEMHEAFASQVLATLAAWEDAEYGKRALGRQGPVGTVDRARLNVHGSSLATGHPFAATGARIVPSLAKILHREAAGRPEGAPPVRGLVSVCAAGGLGVTALLER
ncbi:acetyl-CoA C-acetyltransferase [Streptomyces triticirhizae]|uniref:Acetyl-CoA C-acetyltransferase n=1 Tax=Streptomyces triticirhizae TaxID=2483353 RepID=A0A3M2LVG8_9ACTN|nr:acetyl-CoA C-acetyltransferase [Streptomyces triticirhizae]RMI40553.1 acetyl-CoA C-acetyltransferase [Streptomyces triticirhizae]